MVLSWNNNNNIRKYVTSEINVSYQGPTISPVQASDSYSEWSLCVLITLIIIVLDTISIYRSLKCRKSREKQVALISFLSGLSLFDKLKAIRFISYSGTNYSELFGCNRIIRSCSAAIEFDAHSYSVNTFQYEIYSRYSVICALHTTVISWHLASENGWQ